MRAIKKYYIGIGLLALGTLVLLGFVLVQSSSYKIDKQTNEIGYKISEDLNNYISDEDKIPENLSDATNEKIPESIKFTKESDSRYKFCVTYKNASSPSMDAGSILLQGLYGGYQDPNSYNYQSDYTQSALYISTYSYSKGENCQSVEPIFSNLYNQPQDSFDYSSLDYLCEPDYEYHDLYKDYCVNGKYQTGIDIQSN